MKPLTNSQIAAARTPEMIAADRGQRTQVSQSTTLRAGHYMIWDGDSAEIRDSARGDAVIFSGPRAECAAEANRRGLTG